MRTLPQFGPPNIVLGLLSLAPEPATESPEQTGKTAEEIGDDAD